ncbi:unnamed protein product (macronuclear) [Paramecium tetraurelia]|uniref:TNFR-Cys domain-containing protein n=1 Tax=Paramecium tetraurelia TaxID=5888 RepID=A0CI22_PARTE|nr:uncharacterized protein GSPATT00038543001 [Paramecium tetraurelia]CAK70439.1 unnamed protein product [Paramecium tetraurelia]|eukprot:XP_001437836.1 hypothetical protein (macronuclear) [Paramecium tetraurelia strain d4-2]
MFSILIWLVYMKKASCFVQVYSFDANDQNQDCWNITNMLNTMFRTCDSQVIFGGPKSFGMNTYITRFFNDLDPHYKLKIEIELWIIDKWTSDQINIEIDNTLQFQKGYTHSDAFPDYCGTGSLLDDDDDSSVYSDEQDTILITIPHVKRSVWVHIYVDVQTDENQSWGIKTFKLSIEKCLNGCLACFGDDYSQCLKWQKHTQSFSQSYISGSDLWDGIGFPLNIFQSDQCSGCNYFYGMKFRRFLNLPKKQQILLRLFKYEANTFQILLNNLIYKIIYNPIGQIQILIDDWKGEIYEILLESLSSNLYIRDIDIYYADREEENIIQFMPGCVFFIDLICNQCYEGWKFIDIHQMCQPYCGDKLIVGDEECDDGNDLSHDGCFQCQFQCDQNCLVCQFGKCVECQNSFELNSDQLCLPICGDGFVVPYTEEKCEDVNNIEGDGCFNCKFECDQMCSICYLKKCLECQKGYQLIDNQCYPYCGDKIVINGFEDCDDGNLLPFDGCFECKFQCQASCIICQEGKCNDQQCEDGYKLLQGECISICGDQYVTSQEECDDSNDIEYDGCHNCKYSCTLNCFDCQQGQCLVCEEQYQITKSGECQQIKISYEEEYAIIECDDGNDLPNDGCYNQMIEFNWVCSEYSIDTLSQCTFSVNPKLILTFLNYTQDTQFVKISFSEQVMTTSQFVLTDTMETLVIDVSEDKQLLNLSIIQDASAQLSQPEYVIAIQIFQLLEIKPILQIKLNQQIVNQYGASVIPNDHYITINIPNYLDEVQKVYSLKLKQVNKSIIYFILGVGIISLFFGMSELFLQIINILQYQQYLRYLNLKFPQNLLIYFELGDLLQSQTLMDYFCVQDFFQFFEVESNFKTSYEKFYYYNLNVDLIQNIQWQLFQCIICLLIISIVHMLQRVFYYHIFTDQFVPKISTLLNCIKNQFLIKILQGFYKLFKWFLSLEEVATYNGIKQLLLINGWDLIFKTLLYLQSINSVLKRDITSLILSSIILLAYLIILISACNRETLIRNISPKFLLLKRYEIFNLLRQTSFLIILVFLQRQEILQTLLIALICVMCLKIVYNYRKVFEMANFLVQFCVEGSIILFTFTSLVYVSDYAIYINQELKIKFGWFHISILSIGLIVQLIMIIYERIRSFYKKHQHGKEKFSQVRKNSHLILVEIKNRVIIQDV